MKPRSEARRRAFVAWLAALAAGPGGLAAQTPAELDRGRFEITAAGVRVGEESFGVRRRGDELTAVGRIRFEADSGRISFEVGLQLDPDRLPVRYEMRATDGEPSRIVAARSAGRIRLTVSSSAGERVRELRADRELLILERPVAHHYQFLIRRLLAAGGGDPSLRVLVPRDGEAYPLTVEGVEPQTIRIGDRSVSVRHWRIRIGDQLHEVWAEPDGRVLRVSVPAAGWMSTRLHKE